MVKIITDKKEIIEYIGGWNTDFIYSEYELGSEKIYLKYVDDEVIFKSDNIKDVAYIALECHAIAGRQYADILNKYNYNIKELRHEG